MSQILYTVRVTIPDEKIAAEYIRWLETGHTQAICRFADRARIFRLEPAEDKAIRFESRYEFKDRTLYESYLREAAPALRVEALEKFGPSRGIQWERWTEELVFETSKRFI